MSQLLTLFWIFFKIGLFTIGGGYAMIPLIRDEVVGGGYISDSLFVNILAVSEGTPGPVAVNMSTFIGMQVGYETGGVGLGYLYAAVTTIGTVLPSFIIMLIVSRLMVKFSDNIAVNGAMACLRPAVVGLIASAFVGVLFALILPNLNLSKITKKGFESFDWVSGVLFVAFFAMSRIKIKGKNIHPLILLGAAAVTGIVIYLFSL